MAEDLYINAGSKTEKYRALLPQLKNLLAGEDDLLPLIHISRSDHPVCTSRADGRPCGDRRSLRQRFEPVSYTHLKARILKLPTKQ